MGQGARRSLGGFFCDPGRGGRELEGPVPDIPTQCQLVNHPWGVGGLCRGRRATNCSPAALRCQAPRGAGIWGSLWLTGQVASPG